MPDSGTQVNQLFTEGKTARINGDYDSAIAFLTRVLEDDPNHVDAHMELGLSYCFSGLFDESIQELGLACGLDPLHVEARLHLAKTYTMLGMYDEGAGAFHAVISLTSPGDKFYDEAQKQLAYFK